MMKSLVVILFVFIHDHSYASLNSLKSSDDAILKQRVKRQLYGSRADADYCFHERCVLSLVSMSENAGLSILNAKYFPVDRTLFQNNNFQQYCRLIKKFTNCSDSCGGFAPKDFMMDAFKILDFLCVDHYDEFIQYLPCYQSVDKALGSVCDKKCANSENYSVSITEPYTRNSGLIYPFIEISLKELCGLFICSTECTASQYMKLCEEKSAAKLIFSFTQRAVKTTFKSFKKYEQEAEASNSYKMPVECYPIIGNGVSKYHFILFYFLLPLLVI